MKKSTHKALAFFKRNAIYFILSLCILAIGVASTLMLVTSARREINDESVFDELDKNENENNNPGGEDVETGGGEITDTPVDSVITFVMPVSNATEINEYCETMTYNSTLGRFSAHLAIDFFAPEGTSVCAVYDGKVEKVENSILEGLSVTIDHGNGLKTRYNSLGETDLKEGQVVKGGEVIGTVSVTNRQEYKQGAHLHFQVFENGDLINPEKYLSFEEK